MAKRSKKATKPDVAFRLRLTRSQMEALKAEADAKLAKVDSEDKNDAVSPETSDGAGEEEGYVPYEGSSALATLATGDERAKRGVVREHFNHEQREELALYFKLEAINDRINDLLKVDLSGLETREAIKKLNVRLAKAHKDKEFGDGEDDTPEQLRQREETRQRVADLLNEFRVAAKADFFVKPPKKRVAVASGLVAAQYKGALRFALVRRGTSNPMMYRKYMPDVELRQISPG